MIKKVIEIILKYCHRMEEHINYFGDDIDIYKSNNQYKDSCALEIIQIGKYAGTLGKEFREKYNKINWSEIVSMKNIFAHNYEGVIDDITWAVIKEDIPNLKEYLENILHDYD